MNSRFLQSPQNLKDEEVVYARKKEIKVPAFQIKVKPIENKAGQALVGLFPLSSPLIILFHVSKSTVETSTKSLSVWPDDPRNTEVL